MNILLVSGHLISIEELQKLFSLKWNNLKGAATFMTNYN